MNDLTIFDQCIDALDLYSYAVMRHYICPKGSASKTIVVHGLTYEKALISLNQYRRSHITRDKESGSYFYLVKYIKDERTDLYGIGGPYDGTKICV